MAYATPEPTLYDQINAHQVANSLSPLGAYAARHAADQDALRRQMFALQLENARDNAAMDRTQFTQKEYFKRLGEMDRIKDENAADLLKRRNEAAARNVKELDALQGGLDSLLTQDDTRRHGEARKLAAGYIAQNYAKELGPLLKTSGRIEEAIAKIKDPALKQEILGEYDKQTAGLLASKTFAVDPAVQARRLALENRINRLNFALGKHMEMGGDLPPSGDMNGPQELYGSPQGSPGKLPLPPQAGPEPYGPPQETGLQGLYRQAKNVLGMAGPAYGAMDQKLVGAATGTDPIYTPEQRAIAQNSENFLKNRLLPLASPAYAAYQYLFPPRSDVPYAVPAGRTDEPILTNPPPPPSPFPPGTLENYYGSAGAWPY